MKVGPYEVLRKLGEGAYGKVYLARKGDASGFATWYALKRIARGKGRGPEFESYLFREARLGGIVNHPNLVRVHEVLSMPREWVLVQDYVDGVTLQTVLERRRSSDDPVPRAVALELGAELLETLHYLHTLRDPEGRQSGFIHRDVKPGNVMLSAGHLKVMDFGVARGEEAGAGTLAGELRGTLAYMAPEQATGAPVGPASDQFAAGLILLEMLSNGSPWGDVRGPAVLGRVVTGDVSEGLATLEDDDPVMPIVMRMLGRDPEARFPTARDAARALRALRAQTPTPPALRDFCADEVARYRDDDDPELDQNPSWTGAWQWVSGGAGSDSLRPQAEVGPVPDLEPEPPGDPEDRAVPLDDEPVEVPFVAEDEANILDDDRVDLDELAEPAPPLPAAAAPAEEAAAEDAGAGDREDGEDGEDGEDLDLELDLEPAPEAAAALADGVVAAAVIDPAASDPGLMDPDRTPEPGGMAMGDLATLDVHRTLPLESAPGARAALLRQLGLTGDGPPPAPSGGIGTGDSLAALQARLGDVDPEKTLPLGVGTSASPPAEEPSVAGPRPGEPAQAGARGSAPAIPAQPRPRKRKKKRKAVAPAQDISVAAALWQQFVQSPLLGAGVLLVLVVFIAATVRLAWVAVQPKPVEEDDPALLDDLETPGRSLPPSPTPAPRVAPAPVEEPDELPGDPSTDALVSAEDPADAEAPPIEADPAGADPSSGDPAAVRASDPTPARATADGEDLDADLQSWRGDEATPAPVEAAPQPGDIIGGQRAGERLLESADGRRRIATRRGEDRGDREDRDDRAEEPATAAAEEPATSAEPASAATGLKFLSSREQPAGAPLSIQVRPDGFYATSVVVYYQWRGEGSAGRKRRALTRQGNGSFALDIPASEVRVDRLQLWFLAQPGDVALGSAGDPQEVRVR